MSLEDCYNDMLDDCHAELKVGNITILPSKALRLCDPIAYRCGLNDYESMLITDGLYCEECEELGDNACTCEGDEEE